MKMKVQELHLHKYSLNLSDVEFSPNLKNYFPICIVFLKYIFLLSNVSVLFLVLRAYLILGEFYAVSSEYDLILSLRETEVV